MLRIAIYDLEAGLTQEKLMNAYQIVRVRIGCTICALFIAYSQYGLDGIATPGIDNSPVDLAEAIEFHEAVKR